MTTVRTALSVLAVTGLMLAAGCGSSSPQTLIVTLNPQSGSGESGTATLTQTSGGVQVVVALDGAKGSQPTHIHEGTCAKLSPVPKWPLANTVDGSGTTTVANLTIAQLLAGTYAINVHKSAKDIATYVACGNIVAAK